MIGLYHDLDVLNNDITIISGEVSTDDSIEGNLISVLYQRSNNQLDVVAFDLMLSAGRFYFGIEKGDYYLLVFNDKNGDYQWQNDEAIVTSMTPINALTVQDPYESPTELHLSKGNPQRLEWKGILSTSEQHSQLMKDYHSLGKVTSFNNPVFSQEIATLGMWRPLRFINEFGFGLYSLEPFDSEKIPVILVHGIDGSPLNWKGYVDKMGNTNYQYLMYHYPSGLDLWFVSWYLAELLEVMISHSRVDDIFIVAHSMGGLVSAGAILELQAKNIDSNIKKFVSVSTPWKGHQSAQYGKDYAPVVMPVWNDIAPDSEFIQMLNQYWLPPHIDYGLIFSTSGESLTSLKNNDGAVTIDSQLSWIMQQQATIVRGLSRSHTGILEDKRLTELTKAVFDYQR